MFNEKVKKITFMHVRISNKMTLAFFSFLIGSFLKFGMEIRIHILIRSPQLKWECEDCLFWYWAESACGRANPPKVKIFTCGNKFLMHKGCSFHLNVNFMA